MAQVGEYAGIVGLLVSLAAVAPKLLAVMTRRKQIDVQGEINRFEVILKAQDSQIKEAVWPEMQNALLGRKDAKTALAEAERKVNRLLSR